jgi:hypothetical protein
LITWKIKYFYVFGPSRETQNLLFYGAIVVFEFVDELTNSAILGFKKISKLKQNYQTAVALILITRLLLKKIKTKNNVRHHYRNELFFRP